MRLLATILAVLVLFLSAVPCSDGAIIPVNEVGCAAPALADKEHHGHGHEGVDLCSPFCVCTCCAVFSVVVIPFRLPERTALSEPVRYSLQPGSQPVSMPFPVWQPPQLV